MSRIRKIQFSTAFLMLALIGSTLLLVLWAQYEAAKLKTKRDIECHINDLAKKLEAMPKEPYRDEFLRILAMKAPPTRSNAQQWIDGKDTGYDGVYDIWEFEDGVRFVVNYCGTSNAEERKIWVTHVTVFHENGGFAVCDAFEQETEYVE